MLKSCINRQAFWRRSWYGWSYDIKQAYNIIVVYLQAAGEVDEEDGEDGMEKKLEKEEEIEGGNMVFSV